MQYSVFVNVKAISDLNKGLDEDSKLDYIDGVIFDCVRWLLQDPDSHLKRILVDAKEYTWVSYALIIKELPDLGISSKDGVYRRIKKLIAAGLLEKHIDEGMRTWLRPGPNFSVWWREKERVSSEGSDLNPGGTGSKTVPPSVFHPTYSSKSNYSSKQISSTPKPPRKARTVKSAGALDPEKKSELNELWKILDEHQGLPPPSRTDPSLGKKRSGFSFSYATLFDSPELRHLQAARELLRRWLSRCQSEDLIPHTAKDRWAWVFEEFEAAISLVTAKGLDQAVENLNSLIDDPYFRRRLKSLRQYQGLIYEKRTAK